MPEVKSNTATDPAKALSLEGAVPPQEVVKALRVNVLHVTQEVVVVDIGDGRRGAFRLDDPRNAALKEHQPKEGDQVQGFVLRANETGNLLLTHQRGKKEDRWRQIYQAGSVHEGTVAAINKGFLDVDFTNGTTGRIYAKDLPGGVRPEDFHGFASISCEVIDVHGRRSKTLNLRLAPPKQIGTPKL